MFKGMEFFLLLMVLMYQADGDCYMQSPRGSNNRLNEQSANRNNGNRLFDSQNNNRGGYNVGDLTATAFQPGATTNTGNTYFGNSLDMGQYAMMFFEKSHLTIEWTNQHGCGGSEANNPNKLNCQLVFQYGWETDNTHADLVKAPQLFMNLKSGRNTNTPGTANTINDFANQHATNDQNGVGRHEYEAWYYMCSKIPRNKGLFLADQNVKGQVARYTRQNPNGNRRGLECPEERDYFPYWHPTPWVDLAILTDNLEDCTKRFKYNTESQNVKAKTACIWTGTPNEECYKHYNNDTTCAAETGCQVKTFTHGLKAPRCEQAPWTRANSLGNGDDGMPTQLNITLPALSNTLDTGIGKYAKIVTVGNGVQMAKGILRIRYNISTDDYDPAKTNASFNKNLQAKPKPIFSPVQQNPTVDIGLDSLQGLRLAINTNQFGRTFQDRTHVFYLMSNKAGDPYPADFRTGKIQNIVVRGKRGNIVQTFPAIEYDFCPTRVHLKQGDLIHMQWTGSNTHKNGNPAGDGQAGDAGEGTRGTDRSNVMPLNNVASNFPCPFNNTGCIDTNLIQKFKCFGPEKTDAGGGASNRATDFSNMKWSALTPEQCALRLTSSGYYQTFAELKTKTTLNVLLNNAPASLCKGIMLKVPTDLLGSAEKKTFEYMCTRNNNFSNRSQKGAIVIDK